MITYHLHLKCFIFALLLICIESRNHTSRSRSGFISDLPFQRAHQAAESAASGSIRQWHLKNNQATRSTTPPQIQSLSRIKKSVLQLPPPPPPPSSSSLELSPRISAEEEEEKEVADEVADGTKSTSLSARPIKCFHIYGVVKSGTTWLTTLTQKIYKFNCQKIEESGGQPSCKKYCGDPSREKHVATTREITMTSIKDISLIIFRDTRDVLVSKFHWAQHGLDSIGDLVRNESYGVADVIDRQNFFMSTAKKLEQKNLKYLVLYYETLQKYPEREARKISSILGFKYDASSNTKAIEAASFEAMRSKESKGKLKLKVHPDSSKQLQEDKPPEELFGVMTRKGKVGGYADEMDSETIKYVEDMMRERLNKVLLKRYLPSTIPAPTSH